MFNDTPAQKYNRLLGVKQMVFTYKSLKLQIYIYILNIHMVINTVVICHLLSTSVLNVLLPFSISVQLEVTLVISYQLLSSNCTCFYMHIEHVVVLSKI